jgi:hypothetical protein
VDLQVRAWTDDPAWGERTLELVAAALPLLEERLGVPYPEVGALVVEETVAGAQDLGGEPAPSGTSIQVGFDQPPFTVLHQLAHVWLADDLVSQRWIGEGFASWMAAGAAAELDVDPAFDPAARREELADDAFPLVSWGAGESTPQQDAFAYAASWAVAEEIAAAVGEDDLRLAWGRIAAGTSPYQPIGEGAPAPGVPSPARQPVDSRALLDHLEAVGEADLGEIFRRWVLDEETAGQLAERAEARAALDDLLAAAGDWGAPEPVKVDLAAWRFESAGDRIDEALAWLADRDELLASAEAAGLSVPQRLRDRYRTAGGGDDARTELQAEAAVVDAYAAALARNAAQRGILERIGLLGGADPDDQLAEANRLFAEGDLRGAADLTAEAGTRLEQAATHLLLLALALGLARRQRRRPAPVGSASDSDYTAAP